MSDLTKDRSFGGLLREARLSSRITLRLAAQRLRMDAGNYSKLERSILPPPMSKKRITEICRAVKAGDVYREVLLSLAYQHHLSIFQRKFEDRL